MSIKHSGVQYYNQKLHRLPKYIDPVIQRLYKKSRLLFAKMVPKGSFAYGEGLVQHSHRWHGAIGDQAGLTTWSKVDVSRLPGTRGADDKGLNACGYDPKIVDIGSDTIEFTGYGTSRQTLPVCIKDWRFTWQFRQQAVLYTETLAKVAMENDDNFAQEYYIHLACEAGNAFVLTDDPLDTSNRFSYNPFVADADGDTYITIPRALRISTLNWTLPEYWSDYLTLQCPDGTIGGSEDEPLIGMVFHKRDFQRMITEDRDLREDFRYHDVSVLVEGFGKVRQFKQCALFHHPRAPRFKIKSMTATHIVAKRVLPFNNNRVITIGFGIDTNQDYITAELALGIIWLNNVYQNLIPPAGPPSPGGGMFFGAMPSYNGEFRWLNIQDAETNPLNEVGFFFARMERFPKPLLYADQAIVFLYRRCPNFWSTGCEVRSTYEEAEAGELALIASTSAYSLVTGEDNLAEIRLTKRLPVGLGDEVTVTTDSGSTVTAVIGETQDAPTYILVFADGDRPAAADMNDTAVAGVTA